jgi:hypothetical protein
MQKKADIPICFNYNLDGIGYNGIIYSVKSIDLNSETIDQIRRHFWIWKFKSKNWFVCTQKVLIQIKKQTLFYIDKYKGQASYKELYDILSGQKSSDCNYHQLTK